MIDWPIRPGESDPFESCLTWPDKFRNWSLAVQDNLDNVPLASITGALEGYGPLANMRAGIVHVLDEGADGTGVADSYAAFQSAIDALGPDDILDIGNGLTYTLSDTPVVAQSFRMRGSSTIRYQRDKVGLKVAPTWGTVHTISSFAAERFPAGVALTCAKLGCTNWASYTRGDIVLVYSDDNLAVGTGKRGELHMVAGTATGYIYLSGTLADTYTTNPKIRKHPMCVVDIDGPIFTADGDPTAAVSGRQTAALEITGCVDSRVNVSVHDTWARGVMVISCINSEFNVRARNCRDDVTNGAYGYGLTFACATKACKGSVQAINCRHAFTTNVYPVVADGWYGGQRDCLIHDSIAYACSSNAYDTHEGAYNITFANCRAINTREGDATVVGQRKAFSMRGANITLIDCSLDGLGEFLEDVSSSSNYEVPSLTLVIGGYARISDADFALTGSLPNLYVYNPANGSYASNCRAVFRGFWSRGLRVCPGATYETTYENCTFENAPVWRIAASQTMTVRNCNRRWDATGSMEPIRLLAGSTLYLDGFVSEGTHANNSVLRGESGPGTWTVKGSRVSSPTSGVGFKSDDSSGTWAVTDTELAVA